MRRNDKEITDRDVIDSIINAFVKSQKTPFFVIPAEAGIQ